MEGHSFKTLFFLEPKAARFFNPEREVELGASRFDRMLELSERDVVDSQGHSLSLCPAAHGVMRMDDDGRVCRCQYRKWQSRRIRRV
jgi:hypothetical protein